MDLFDGKKPSNKIRNGKRRKNVKFLIKIHQLIFKHILIPAGCCQISRLQPKKFHNFSSWDRNERFSSSSMFANFLCSFLSTKHRFEIAKAIDGKRMYWKLLKICVCKLWAMLKTCIDMQKSNDQTSREC